MHTSALVLFSGGQDSTTCLAHALSRYDRVETLALDYGQRHKVELEARLNVLAAIKAKFPQWAPKMGEDHLLDAGILGQISETSLTRATAIEMESSGLPNTFVPGRNLLFLTLAAALAYRRGLQVIVTGVCETDFSGYPDCRDDTMKAMQVALSLGMDRKLLIETPLMWIDKAQTWQLAHDLGQKADLAQGGQALVDLIVEHTHTCYLGDRTQRQVWGYGCGQCPACQLRAAGFARYRQACRAGDSGPERQAGQASSTRVSATRAQCMPLSKARTGTLQPIGKGLACRVFEAARRQQQVIGRSVLAFVRMGEHQLAALQQVVGNRAAAERHAQALTRSFE
jgi:7-cyano-7-deazaguanine synthase